MNRDFLKALTMGTTLLAAFALAGCGTPAAKNFGGTWKPVNHFRSAPVEIPLNPAYVYYASPLDGTLKTMLTRWASDSGRQLSYQLPFDVTLYQPVSGIRTTDIDAALAQLNSIYALQKVFVTASARRIVVEPSRTASQNTAAHTAIHASEAAPAATE